MEYAILKEGQPFKSTTRAIAEIADPANILEEFPLTDFPPANTSAPHVGRPTKAKGCPPSSVSISPT